MLKKYRLLSLLIITALLVLAAACSAEPAAQPEGSEPEAEAVVDDQVEDPEPEEAEPVAEDQVEEPEAEDTEAEDEAETEQEDAPDDDLLVQGEALLNDRCADCHSIETATGKTKTLAEWENTIDRMIQKGAQLTPDERDLLAAYLTETAGQ